MESGGIPTTFDLTVFISADVDALVASVKVRNQIIPGYTTEEIEKRAEIVDRKNAEIAGRTVPVADLVVTSFHTRAS